MTALLISLRFYLVMSTYLANSFGVIVKHFKMICDHSKTNREGVHSECIKIGGVILKYSDLCNLMANYLL